jgi:hypothetical protein
VLSGPQTPSEVAANLDWYFHQYLHFPNLLAVQTVPFDPPLPDPDGRILRASGYDRRTNFESVYNGGQSGLAFGDPIVALSGQDGLEIYTGRANVILFEKILVKTMAGLSMTQRF